MYHLHKLYQDFISPDVEAVRMRSLFTSFPNLQYQAREIFEIITQMISYRRECRQAG